MTSVYSETKKQEKPTTIDPDTSPSSKFLQPSTNIEAKEQKVMSDTAVRKKSFSSKRSLSAPNFSIPEGVNEFDNLTDLNQPMSQSSRKAERIRNLSQDDFSTPKSQKERQQSISKLKANVRQRRKSLMQHPDHTITAHPDSFSNFVPLQGSKFEEALAITLRRDQEAGKKKYLKKKYRAPRSDEAATKKRQRQVRKKTERLAKGKKEKAKDIIHKGHEQFALTWGMMMGVQLSVGRQFEFSAKNPSTVDMKEYNGEDENDNNVIGEDNNSGNGDDGGSTPEQMNSNATTSRLRSTSMAKAKKLSLHKGVSAAVDEESGELVTSLSMEQIKTQSSTAKSERKILTNSTSEGDESKQFTPRRKSNLRGDMDMFADSLNVTDFMAVDKYIFPLLIKSKFFVFVLNIFCK
jgi:hypothetical protein